MAFKPQQREREYWETVDLGDDGTFDVQVRRPDFGERSQDRGAIQAGFYGDSPEEKAGTQAVWIKQRIQTAIVGWRDIVAEVEKDGKLQERPMEFTHDKLFDLCGAYPTLFDQLADIAHKAFRGMDAETEKNSRGKRSASTNTASPVTPSAASTPDSGKSEDSAEKPN